MRNDLSRNRQEVEQPAHPWSHGPVAIFGQLWYTQKHFRYDELIGHRCNSSEHFHASILAVLYLPTGLFTAGTSEWSVAASDSTFMVCNIRATHMVCDSLL